MSKPITEILEFNPETQIRFVIPDAEAPGGSRVVPSLDLFPLPPEKRRVLLIPASGWGNALSMLSSLKKNLPSLPKSYSDYLLAEETMRIIWKMIRFEEDEGVFRDLLPSLTPRSVADLTARWRNGTTPENIRKTLVLAVGILAKKAERGEEIRLSDLTYLANAIGSAIATGREPDLSWLSRHFEVPIGTGDHTTMKSASVAGSGVVVYATTREEDGEIRVDLRISTLLPPSKMKEHLRKVIEALEDTLSGEGE